MTPEQEVICLSNGDPLDGGEDPIVYISDKFLTARKRHQCMYCLRWIEQGERHRKITAIASEQWGQVRYCAECCEAQAAACGISGYDEVAVDRWIARLGMFKGDRK